MARISLDDLIDRPSDIDAEKLDATTEADICRYQIEDGYDSDDELPEQVEVILPLRGVRRQLRMTQVQIAALVGVPLRTYRDWEKGRTTPDPAARTLFNVLAREPHAALHALGISIPDAA